MKEPGFTPQRPTQEQHREGHWSYEELKQHILAAYPTGEGRSVLFDALPKTMDLGKMATKTLECVRRMNEDPRHREHGASIIYDPRKKSLIMHRDEQIIIGSEESILPTAKAIIDSSGGYSEFVTFIHTHPDLSTFSPEDILSLLYGEAIHQLDSFGQLYILGNKAQLITALLASAETTRQPNREDFTNHYENIFTHVRDRIQAKKASSFQPLTYEEELHAQHITIAKLAEEYKLGYYRGDQSGILRRFRVKKPAQE